MLKKYATLFVATTLSTTALAESGFLSFERAQQVVDTLVSEHQLPRDQVEEWMRAGSYRKSAVSNAAAPAEQTKSYREYRPMFLASSTIAQGVVFAKAYEELLTQAEQTYGVPANIIVSIIGIESRYGRSQGRYRAFDSLGSLTVAGGRRADYFQREWTRFLLIHHQLGLDPLSTEGSYAGASGFPQFMPTSYQAYAVDHDQDGDIDIWSDPIDAIGSVANYLRENGWDPDEPILAKVSKANDQSITINSFERDRKLADVTAAGWGTEELPVSDWYVFPIRLEAENGPEYWLGYRNFWSISRYNRSVSYAMAVAQLAEAIDQSLEENAQ